MTDANRTWFTADTHFGHANVIKHSSRPFSSMEEMDERLILNWNHFVQPGHDVFHLGDVAWRDAIRYIDRLNGNIHLIRGNHESASEKIKHRFIWIKDVAEIKLRFEVKDDRIEGGIAPRTQFIFLSHYAHRVWPRSHHGVWHLYGHSHGSLYEDRASLSFDIGVDATARRISDVGIGGQIVPGMTFPENYRPLSFADISSVMSKRVFRPIDHHSGVVSHAGEPEG